MSHFECGSSLKTSLKTFSLICEKSPFWNINAKQRHDIILTMLRFSKVAEEEQLHMWRVITRVKSHGMLSKYWPAGK